MEITINCFDLEDAIKKLQDVIEDYSYFDDGLELEEGDILYTDFGSIEG